MSSAWSDVVHENRKRAELQRAREELRLRRRGYAVEEKPSAGIPAVLSLAGVLTAAAWWRKEGRKAHGRRDWKTLPGVSQLLDFLQSGSQPKRGPTRSKAKPKTQLAPPSKAAAARQQAAGGRPTKPGSSSSSGGSSSASAAAAAGAAAVKRAGGGGRSSAQQLPPRPLSSSPQPEASTSASASSSSQQQQSKAKKKKNKKKKK